MEKIIKIILFIIVFIYFFGMLFLIVFLSKENKQLKNKPPETIIIERNISPLPYKDLGEFEITFYSPQELGAKNRFDLKTSIGRIPKQGRTVAVDPKIIPYGSIIYIKNQGYFIAEDCGGKIKGNRLDIFVNDYKVAVKSGRIKAEVYLLKGVK